MNDDDRDAVYRGFHDAVNMNRRELERWLETDESKSVGQKKSAGAESIGHRSGRQILSLLRKKRADLTASDVSQMRRVSAFVARKLAQRPSGDVRDTRWRYSLMNWGRDPLGR